MASGTGAGRNRVRCRTRRWAVAGGFLLLLCGLTVGLQALARHPRPPLSPARAIAAAEHDPGVNRSLRRARWTSAAASVLDARLERVDFFARDRIVLEVAVDRNGRIADVQDYSHQATPFGNWILYQPAVVVVLSALFLLAAGVAPLRRLRNLDALAAASLSISALLLARREVDASVLSALPGTLYLLLRAGWRGLRPGEVRPSTPLLDLLFAGRTDGTAILRMIVAALGLMLVMVAVSSPRAVDVVYALMEGATGLLHGVLPYSHLPGDVVHGDTYPLLSYVAYTPVAWLAPVRSTWDSVDVALGFTAAVALLGAALQAGIARVQRPSDPPESGTDGLRAALLWLSFPPLLIAVSSGTNDVLLAAILAGALLLWRRPTASTAVLALAGWFKLVPFALVPLWVARLRGRARWAAAATVGALSAGVLGVVLALGGPGGIEAMVRDMSYQLTRTSPQSLWSVLGIGAAQPLAEAALLLFVLGAVLRLSREPELASDLGRMAALSAAILLGLQLLASYWTFLYLVWAVPLLAASLLTSSLDAAPAGAEGPDPVAGRLATATG